MGPTTLFLLRRKSFYRFSSPLKIYCPWPGFNLRNLGPMVSMLPLDHWWQLECLVNFLEQQFLWYQKSKCAWCNHWFWHLHLFWSQETLDSFCWSLWYFISVLYWKTQVSSPVTAFSVLSKRSGSSNSLLKDQNKFIFSSVLFTGEIFQYHSVRHASYSDLWSKLILQFLYPCSELLLFSGQWIDDPFLLFQLTVLYLDEFLKL